MKRYSVKSDRDKTLAGNSSVPRKIPTPSITFVIESYFMRCKPMITPRNTKSLMRNIFTVDPVSKPDQKLCSTERHA